MKEYYINPFNYTGAKHKLFSQILPLFPMSEINTFVDLFGGSAEVSLNVRANNVIYNDKSEALVNILKNLDDNFVSEIENLINKYGLSKTNKQGFLNLRNYYNSNFKFMSDREKAVTVYCLVAYSFNNQFAFNSQGEFNTPFGLNRSWFNPSLRNKLIRYINRIKEINITFNNSDFHNLNLDQITPNKFFYADPPYLITTGAYERDYYCKWSEQYEKELLNLLDIIDVKGCKFALSNVLTHKGKSNDILIEWSKKYNVHHLDKEYKSCNYQTHSRKNRDSDEVLITNY